MLVIMRTVEVLTELAFWGVTSLDNFDAGSTGVDPGHVVLSGQTADATCLIQLGLVSHLVRLLQSHQVKLAADQVDNSVPGRVTLLVSGVPGEKLNKV